MAYFVVIIDWCVPNFNFKPILECYRLLLLIPWLHNIEKVSVGARFLKFEKSLILANFFEQNTENSILMGNTEISGLQFPKNLHFYIHLNTINIMFTWRPELYSF